MLTRKDAVEMDQNVMEENGGLACTKHVRFFDSVQKIIDSFAGMRNAVLHGECDFECYEGKDAIDILADFTLGFINDDIAENQIIKDQEDLDRHTLERIQRIVDYIQRG